MRLLLLCSLAGSAFAITAGPLRPALPMRTSRHVTATASQLPPSGTKLDDFLLLLGRCYGAAGVAHAIDFATGNALPAMAAVPPFQALPPAGQAMGVFWCLIGAAQPLASDRAQQKALAAAYGVYEILLTVASGAVTNDPEGTTVRLAAAAGLQAVVFYCYVELRRQSLQPATTRAKSDPSRLGRPRMQLSEDEIQAKLSKMRGTAQSELPGPRVTAGGDLGIAQEVGVFAAAIVIFAVALVVSLS